MPNPAYMTIQGVTQGNISEGASTQESVGGSWQEAHKDEIIVQAFDHDVMIPTDPQTGQPSGKRRHEKMTIIKSFDKSSPLLYNALVNGEQLDEVVITWFRTAPDGTEEHYFTMTLNAAIIVDIRAHMPHCQDPATERYGHEEHIAFRYRSIEWRHEVGGTSGRDEWGKPEG